MTKVALAVGGNVGDVPAAFFCAITILEQNGLSNIVMSSLYFNPALNCVPGTPSFINDAMTGEWNKTPEELLVLIKRTEAALGRPKRHRSDTSRTLDIDIILFGETIISERKLTIPHPRARERDFVLMPLNEIAPDWIFPDTKKTVNTVFKELYQSKRHGQLL